MRYERLNEAIAFAHARHAGSDRDGKDPLPYVVHPIEVLLFVREIGDVRDEDALVAAVLHDVLEETDATETDLVRRFGERATEIVRMLTREEPSEAATRGMTSDEIWTLRSGMFLDEIRTMPDVARPIKLADRLSNVRESRRTKAGRKFERYLGQTREILRIIPRECNPPLWDAVAAEASTPSADAS